MPAPDSADTLNLLDELITKARKAGADSADAVAVNARSVSHVQRLGKMENLESSEARDLGLRVMVGQKQAVVSSNDWDRKMLKRLVEQAVAMARAVPDDPFIGLADPDALQTGELPNLDSFDPSEPDAETLIERAKITEDAALSVDGVSNSEGAEASWASWDISLAASNGFTGQYRNSNHAVSVMVLAGSGVEMESDYDYSSCVYGENLKDLKEIGRQAGKWAVDKLHPRKGPTCQAPVIFDPRIASGIAGHLASAINGSAIAKGTSFLKDSLGKQIMGKGINLIEDPHRIRGLASKPFDAEGIATQRKYLVREGMLQTWVLDLRTARQLGMQSTGNASRGPSGPPAPSVTNLYIDNGDQSPAALMADIDSGFYITSMMGMGINMVTGDYSRGASGFWIENGEIAYPVNEMTVAGNLKDMFLNMTVANDLKFDHAMAAPTLRIDGMTIAGV